MKNRRVGRLLVVSAVLFALFASGCTSIWQAYSHPDRQRRRAYAIRTDLDRIADDVDYIFGLHRPSSLYDETFPQ